MGNQKSYIYRRTLINVLHVRGLAAVDGTALGGNEEKLCDAFFTRGSERGQRVSGRE